MNLLKARKDGKILLEVTIGPGNYCRLSDPNGPLVEAWGEDFDGAMLKRGCSLENPNHDIWCIRNTEKIFSAKMVSQNRSFLEANTTSKSEKRYFLNKAIFRIPYFPY